MFAIMFVGSVIWMVLFYGGMLFGPAGTLDWPRAWVFVGVTAAVSATAMIVLRRSPELIKDRLRGPWRKGQPLADMILVALLLLAYCGQMVFAALDVFRFHLLLGGPPLALAVVGLLAYVGGWAILTEALRENPFASPAVRYQEEREQKLIDTGLYGRVRHPMYMGAMFFVIGAQVWLGSYAAILASAVFLPIVVVRIAIEEGLLRRELEGYEEYTKRVRYRLVPYIW